MDTLEYPHDDHPSDFRFSRRIAIVGWLFAAIGALAILLPVAATVTAETLIAWMLVLWGVAGLWFTWEMQSAQESLYAAVTFGVTVLLGVVFVLFPQAGIETLTIATVLALLMEGVVSILLGLRTSAHLRNWGWLVFSGACALVAGFVILIGWPGTTTWSLGLLMGLNFLSTGLSLVMFAHALGKPI